MNVVNKIKKNRLLLTSTIFESRSLLFWGYNRAVIKRTKLYKSFVCNNRSLSFKMGDFVLSVKNELLTQTHKDILEIILGILGRDRYRELTISHNQILEKLNKSTRNYTWLYGILEELENVNIRFHKHNEEADVVGGKGMRIISTLEYDTKSDFIKIQLDKGLLQLYEEAGVMEYSAMTPIIANLKQEITKQVVRWFLTYDNINIDIENLINFKLGFKNIISQRTLRKYVRGIKKEKQILEKFGITYNEDIFTMCRPKDFCYFNGRKIEEIEAVNRVKIKQSKLPFFELK